MQQLWLNKIEWDTPIPQERLQTWEDYYQSLPELNDLQIPRNVNPGNSSEKVKIFGFGDASQRAYGACLYVVSTSHEGNKQAHLLCSKSRVAPLKTISLPRLELEAALLLGQLLQSAQTAFKDRIECVRLWSDSTIVLGWIQTAPHELKTFVGNRVAKIQNLTEGATWSHVPSEQNPADILSRGTTVDDLKSSDLWWHGPAWLISEEQRPENMEQPAVDLPERKLKSVSLIVTTTSQLLHRFSSYAKLCRVVAYCHRFTRNTIAKVKRDVSSVATGTICPKELARAEKTVVRMVQGEVFASEVRCLQNDRELPRKSPLIGLKPFINKEGIICVGGRLEHAEIPFAEKHPMILPARHHVTHIYMRGQHQKLQHCPPEQLLHSVRANYWPLSGRREAQKVVRRCVKCFRFKPTSPSVLMGDLPAERVQAFCRPFAATGVDYAGPLQIRESRRRGRVHVSKGYVAIFVCLSTKAVHLELISDLTSEAFLAALQRFTARRGLCAHLFSDNGTNFVGADRELREIFECLTKEESTIAGELAERKITWHFIPPRAPHFGGLWEAGVKVMKRHLYTVTQGKTLTVEEYSTLLCDIEAAMNSRPLTPLTNDPSDNRVLTPSHFLIGDSLVLPVELDVSEVVDNRLSRWQHLRKMRQLLWSRWQQEYLKELQRRSKWNTSDSPVTVDTLVLLVEDNVPPLQWPIGRITEVHPGADGAVRVATVLTKSGLFKRAVKRLCPLPITQED